MSVNAYPGGESPFHGEGTAIVLICDQCASEWEPTDEFHISFDEDGPCLNLADADNRCPSCGSEDSDWMEVW